jgi:hypothetical protein
VTSPTKQYTSSAKYSQQVTSTTLENWRNQQNDEKELLQMLKDDEEIEKQKILDENNEKRRKEKEKEEEEKKKKEIIRKRHICKISPCTRKWVETWQNADAWLWCSCNAFGICPFHWKIKSNKKKMKDHEKGCTLSNDSAFQQLLADASKI